MDEYRRCFGTHECSIKVTVEQGSATARLFTMEQEQAAPILDEYGNPVALTATTPAWVYLKAVRFLTAHFGSEP